VRQGEYKNVGIIRESGWLRCKNKLTTGEDPQKKFQGRKPSPAKPQGTSTNTIGWPTEGDKKKKVGIRKNGSHKKERNTVTRGCIP